ncbi:MAG: acyl-ACP--UDP-N-acetylglucosamine O-acyltransferase [Terrimicrobiaceae bacterium]
MNIHPTALVDAQAQLAEDVVVGPHVIIGEHVTLGAGSVVEGQVVIEGKTTIGEDNHIGRGAIIGTPPQDYAFNKAVHSEVRIGRGNLIREFVTIHCGTKEGSATLVGDECVLMTGCHLGHNARLGNRVVVHNNCLLGGYVEVGDCADLGVGSVYHQFLRVGTWARVRESTRSVKDIPPYVCVTGFSTLWGINSLGLRKAGWTISARRELKEAFQLIYQSELNISQALEQARQQTWRPEVLAFFDFIRSSKRGVCSKLTKRTRVVASSDVDGSS